MESVLQTGGSRHVADGSYQKGRILGPREVHGDSLTDVNQPWKFKMIGEFNTRETVVGHKGIARLRGVTRVRASLLEYWVLASWVPG
jgi:hypothetical protein